MKIKRRVFVSVPDDRHLTPTQIDLRKGVLNKITEIGYIPEIFFTRHGSENSIAGRQVWTAEAAEKVARNCHAAVLFGLPRWEFDSADKAVLLPTEYAHYEGALFRTLGLPMLILAQENLMRRAVFDNSFAGPFIGNFPPEADSKWVSTAEFTESFEDWRKQVELRRDVFFGYCGSSKDTAAEIRSFLESNLKISVLDWQTDFCPGRNILAEIEQARVRCTCGIFLFTKDDFLDPNQTTHKSPDVALPRDNVVFEAGYFISAKGKDRVLIIRERGAKMPADLGGDSYVSFEKGRELDPVYGKVEQFFSVL